MSFDYFTPGDMLQEFMKLDPAGAEREQITTLLQSAQELKFAAGFLITNHSQKHYHYPAACIVEAEHLRRSGAFPRRV